MCAVVLGLFFCLPSSTSCWSRWSLLYRHVPDATLSSIPFVEVKTSLLRSCPTMWLSASQVRTWIRGRGKWLQIWTFRPLSWHAERIRHKNWFIRFRGVSESTQNNATSCSSGLRGSWGGIFTSTVQPLPPFLVHAIEPPRSKNDKYIAITGPLGYNSRPVDERVCCIALPCADGHIGFYATNSNKILGSSLIFRSCEMLRMRFARQRRCCITRDWSTEICACRMWYVLVGLTDLIEFLFDIWHPCCTTHRCVSVTAIGWLSIWKQRPRLTRFCLPTSACWAGVMLRWMREDGTLQLLTCTRLVWHCVPVASQACPTTSSLYWWASTLMQPEHCNTFGYNATGIDWWS